MYSNGPFWFYLVLSTVVSLIPDIILKVIENINRMNTVIKLKNIEMERIKKCTRIARNEEKESDTKKVRVFYVPPGVNRVFDTKVKDEIISKDKNSTVGKNNEKIINKSFQLHQRF